MCKVFVSLTDHRDPESLSRARGRAGDVSANRIISYLVQCHGVVTAEGDNEVLLIKTARELLMGIEYTPPSAAAELAVVPLLESVDFLQELLRARERTLVLRLREAFVRAQQRASVLDAWNEQ